MHTEPIQREAKRPQGRPRHALLSVLVRLVAVAGFAFAGWLTLSALTHSAFAAERAARPAAGPDDHGLLDQTPRVANLDGAAAIRDLTAGHDSQARNGQAGQARHEGQIRHNGGRATRGGQVGHAGQAAQGGQVRRGGLVRNGGQGRHDRHAGSSVSGVSESLSETVSDSAPRVGPGPGLGPVSGAVPGGVREIREHPVRYLRARQQDVLDGKDRTVRQVRDVAEEAGVPRVRLSDLLQERPVIGGLVHRVTDQQPLLQDGATAAVQQAPKAQPGVDRARDEAAPAAESHARSHARSAAVPVAASAREPAHESAEPCTGCSGDRRTPSPGPALPIRRR
ncbi:hypothetical protein [Actinomadura sp. NPDC049753]|uniref:hypothetical protein n=1 Tax=Actinomadura sp. NPDC049753 TaxID=3154739 RepID=UPI0034240CC8